MAKDNTKAKAEIKPEDEQNSAQQATEGEQSAVQQAPPSSLTNEGQNEDNTPSGVDDATSPVEGDAKSDTEDEQAAAGASHCPTDEDKGQNAAPIKLVVISARGLALRENPSKQAAMLGVLNTGTVLTDRVAEEAAEGWIPVTTRDGKNGWVDCRFVTVVE